MQRLAQLTPTFHACQGLRAALYGGSWTDDALALAACAAASLPLACRLFTAAVGRARLLGSVLEP